MKTFSLRSFFSGLCALCVLPLILLSGCVSAPPGSRAGWTISLVNVTIQMGGTRSDPTIDTINTLEPNSTQTHTLPVTSNPTAGATSLSLPTP